MPTYEYACTECGHRFDIWQPVGSAAPECEKCGQSTKKVFQPPRVIFKGSGFYVTDLRSEKSGENSSSKNSEAKSESNGEPKESSSESKTESKPAESTASTSSPSTSTSSGDKK